MYYQLSNEANLISFTRAFEANSLIIRAETPNNSDTRKMSFNNRNDGKHYRRPLNSPLLYFKEEILK